MTNITFVAKGDLFESKYQTITNAINCLGISGAGIAKIFKSKFPDMADDYELKCSNEEVKIGEPYLFKESIPWVLMFPTKDNWKFPSKLIYIEKGLDYLVNHYQEWGIESLSMPALGCGKGGLNFQDVLPIMTKYLSQMNIPIEIYEPL